MSLCGEMRAQFSEYLDGALTGVAMQTMERHLKQCSACGGEFGVWRASQQALASLGPAKAPADLALRLRVALSREQARTPRNILGRWRVRWQNTVAPYLLQASAGFASAVLLLGTVALLIGAFAVPEPAAARDEPLGMASGPRFLYSTVAGSGMASIGNQANGAVVVEAYIDRAGLVYDYRIVSGPRDPATEASVEDLLLSSVFEPARSFGQPVRGVAILSFSGVAVRG